MKRSFKEYGRLIVCLLSITFATSGISGAENYSILARVESKRKDGLLTLRFDSRPLSDSYFLVEGERVIGRISVVSSDKPGEGMRGWYRVIAYYSLDNPADEASIRAGLEIGLRVEAERKTRDYAEPQKRETVVYKSRIMSPVDGREMVLIPAGKFVFGSDTDQRDEAPERIMELGDYYIDRHEVSNADFLRYVRMTNGQYPGSWKERVPDQSEMELPVMVTWMEAEAYRLQTLQTVTDDAEGRSAGAASSFVKLWWSELDVNLHETALDILGNEAELDGAWTKGWQFALSGPIYAGTNEIQRNIVAERVLGLPRK